MLIRERINPMKFLTPEELLEAVRIDRPPIIIDIREKNKFIKGHLPNAINIPVFSQSQRDAINSYCIKRASGLYLASKIAEFIKPDLDNYISEVKRLIRESKSLNKKPDWLSNICFQEKRKLLVYCWKDNEESRTFADILSSYKLQFFVLKGGYKAYQKTTNEYLFQNYSFQVVGGRIGSGKTAILHELKKSGEQILDLEECAAHSGTVFGTLGKPEQLSNRHYMTAVGLQLSRFDSNRPIWVEEKTRNLGKYWLQNRKAFIPIDTENSSIKYKHLSENSFWEQIKTAPIYRLELPIELRIKRIISEYSQFSINELKQKAIKLIQYLGNEKYTLAMKYLESGNFSECVQVIFQYYDSYYNRTIPERSMGKEVNITLQEDSPGITAKMLIKEFYKDSEL